MTPILEGFVASAIRVFLGRFFLCKMAFVVGGNAAHVFDIFIAVLGCFLLRILLKNLDNLATTVMGLAINYRGNERTVWTHLS